jgi:hypothetical protein
MKEILLSLMVTGILFLVFLFLLILGIRRRKMKPVYVSIVVLLLTVGAGFWTGLLFVSKAYNRVKKVKIENPLRARTGEEIYTALFRKPAHSCVQVINKMDQVVPRLDCCIWLEFKTCPAELRRIIALAPYRKYVPSVLDTSAYVPDYTPRPGWFNPAILGDSIIALRNNDPDNPNHDEILIFSKDSTHAFYCDMMD